MPPIPISHTKVVMPRRRAELLRRMRLLDRLSSFFDKKLILITAPAGYGKTSVLIDMAYHSELPFCWLALDEFDREPQRFISYVIAALAERFPAFGGQSFQALNSVKSLEDELESLVVTITNEIFESIPEHFVLVIDDYHHVNEVPLIRTFVSRFIRLADENCHFVLSSRTVFSIPDMPLIVGRDEAEGLDYVELAFRPEEIQALLAQNYEQTISEQEARELAEKSEGWITGLQLSGLGREQASRARIARASGVDLSAYFAHQVLDKQPALREILLYTSLFDEFDVSLAEAVLSPFLAGPLDWSELLGRILEKNLFVLPVGSEGQWLRYHNLFRDFLRKQLQAEHPEKVPQILARLAGVYEQQGEWEKAYYVTQQLVDAEALAGLVERAGPTMLRRALVTLESWLNGLNPAIVRARPGLLSLRGAILYMKGDLQGGLALLNQAEQSYRETGDICGLTLTLVRRAVALSFAGDYKASIHDADETLQLTETAAELQDLYAEALRVKGNSLYRLGQIRQALDCFERSLALYSGLPKHAGSIPILLMETGMAHRASGDYAAAKVAYQKALKIWRRDGNLSWQANLLNNLGYLHYAQGDYEKAVQTFEEGLTCAKRSRYYRMQAGITVGLGDLFAELEEFDAARQSYQQAEALARETNDQFLSNYLILAQANLALLGNDLSKAREWLAHIHPNIEASHSAYELGLWHWLSGRQLLAEEESRNAVVELKKAEELFEQDGREMEGLWCKVWLTAASHAAGDSPAAINADFRLSNSHAVAVAGYQALPWLTARKAKDRFVKDLVEIAERFGARLPEIRRALRRQPRVISMARPRLSIQALGWTKVEVNGRVLAPSDWQTQAVRELFFFFVTSPRPLTKEQGQDALWPGEEDFDRLNQRFKNDLYRLRRAVGQETIVLQDDRYSFNRTLDYDYDVEDFETYLERARTAEGGDEKISFYERAISLVHGPYLADVGATWAAAPRMHYHEVLQSAFLDLAHLYWKQADSLNTLRVCERALEHDPANENFHQLAMQVYYARGDRAAIIRQYQACKDALTREFNLSPSPETEALYRQFTG
ncbi:MAG: tetratricopeptide repeat protein [Chloroflexota bacterium]